MSVNLRKPVSLTKRANRPSNKTTPSVYPPKKYTPRHAAEYRGEKYNSADCDGSVSAWTGCPACSPWTYWPRHAYRIGMFPISG